LFHNSATPSPVLALTRRRPAPDADDLFDLMNDFDRIGRRQIDLVMTGSTSNPCSNAV